MFVYLFYIPTFFLTLFLGFFVFLKNTKSLINRYLFYFCLSLVVWVFTLIFADSLKDPIRAMFWSKAAIIGPSFAPYFFLLFSYIFPPSNKEFRFTQKLLLLIPTIFIVILSPTHYNLEEISIKDWGAEVKPGSLYYFFIIYYIGYIIVASHRLYKSYKLSEGIQRKQIIYVLFGLCMGFGLGIITNGVCLFLNISQTTILGPISALIIVAFISYAIVVHHLMDIKLMTVQVFMAILWVVLIFKFFFSFDDKPDLIINAATLGISIIFGWILIHALKEEVSLREKYFEHTKELQSKNSKLMVLDRAKTNFIKVASHQMLTPLANIKGYLSMLIDGSYGVLRQLGLSDALVKTYMSNERLIQLTENLLDITYLEEGRVVFKYEEVNLNKIVKNAVVNLMMEAQSKEIYLTFSPCKSVVPNVWVDKEKFSEALVNIVDNAVKYTKKGGVRVKITSDKKMATIIVSDTGVGIDRKDLERLFDKFVRGRDVSKLSTIGIGMGLYVARKMVEAHGGEIWGESPGKNCGSTFYVKMPIVKETRKQDTRNK